MQRLIGHMVFFMMLIHEENGISKMINPKSNTNKIKENNCSDEKNTPNK
jgi:hypothetical protein